MKATETKLLEFLKGQKQFIIPIYQRPYSWTQAQCEQLWKDIVKTVPSEPVIALINENLITFNKNAPADAFLIRRVWLPSSITAGTLLDACAGVDMKIIYVGKFPLWKEEVAAMRREKTSPVSLPI